MTPQIAGVASWRYDCSSMLEAARSSHNGRRSSGGIRKIAEIQSYRNVRLVLIAAEPIRRATPQRRFRQWAHGLPNIPRSGSRKPSFRDRILTVAKTASRGAGQACRGSTCRHCSRSILKRPRRGDRFPLRPPVRELPRRPRPSLLRPRPRRPRPCLRSRP